MIKRNLSKGMINLLKSLIGSNLVSYECDSATKTTYGNIRINTDKVAIEITNLTEDKPLLGVTEEVSGFKCKKVDSDIPFKPYCITPPHTVSINRLIEGVEIVRDDITVKSENYSISFDQAIIIKTPENILTVSRDIWFSEVITISLNVDFDEVYPIKESAYDLSDYGQYEVDVKRTRIQL